MPAASDSQTSLSLLERLRQDPTDEQAWAEFVRRYRGKISAWCCELGLQSADHSKTAPGEDPEPFAHTPGTVGRHVPVTSP